MLETKTSKKHCVLAALVLSLIFLQAFVIISTQFNTPAIRNDTPRASLQTQSFSREDYTSILEEAKNGLGTISVLDIEYNESGSTNSPEDFPNVDDDINQEALNVSYIGTELNRTLLNASRNYLKSEYIDQNKPRMVLNDSLEVKFDNASENNDGLCGYMVYLPHLDSTEIQKIFVNDTEVDEFYYSIENEYVKFNYLNYLNELSGEFSMDILYSYELTIEDWGITQLNGEDIVVKEEIQNISAEYTYQFEVYGRTDAGVAASGLNVSLQVRPFDMEQLNNFSLSLNGEKKANFSKYLDVNNNINISLTDDFTADRSAFSLNFTSEFMVKFLKPVWKTWGIDRLVSGDSIREKIYFPSVIEGPDHLLVKFTFYEPTITENNFRDYSSQFGRSPIVRPYREIVNITTPTLIKGEKACPFTLTYEADNELDIIVRDSLEMPLIGLEIKVYSHGELYGTYISKELIQPHASLTTNENGEISLNNLPNGNYTIKIYYYGIHRVTSMVSTEQQVHYIDTNILHVPILIMVFGFSSAVILGIGILLYYRRNNK